MTALYQFAGLNNREIGELLVGVKAKGVKDKDLTPLALAFVLQFVESKCWNSHVFNDLGLVKLSQDKDLTLSPSQQ